MFNLYVNVLRYRLPNNTLIIVIYPNTASILFACYYIYVKYISDSSILIIYIFIPSHLVPLRHRISLYLLLFRYIKLHLNRDVLRRVTELLRFPNAVGKFGVGVSGGGGSGACTTSGDNGVTVTAGGAVITATGQAIDGSGGSSRDEAEEQQPTTGASAGGGVCCGGAASLIKGAGLERRPSRRLRKLPEVVVS